MNSPKRGQKLWRLLMPSTSCLQSQQINNFAYPTGIQKAEVTQRQYIYLYNFPAESADSIIKVVIDEGRDCGPTKRIRSF